MPVENLLGKEGKGIYVILSNFNHERWVMCCGSAMGSRFIVEECFKWAHQRKGRSVSRGVKARKLTSVSLAVFGKPLIDQPVIRQKFAHMFAKIEAVQAFLEHISTLGKCPPRGADS